MSRLGERVAALLDCRVTGTSSVGGGSIARAYRVETARGTVFAKSLERGTFREEAAGLRALRAAGAIRIPDVLAVDDEARPAVLVLEWIEPGRRGGDFQGALGRSLAALHRATMSARCGFEHDNTIGATPQPNPWSDSWPTFWQRQRLGHQIGLAERAGLADHSLVALVERVIAATPSIMGATAAEPCSLLHGDLWGGNVLCDGDGAPVLIDPAAYVGHREADLGMTTLFGGFGEGFYAAYDATWPLTPGWRGRLPLYSLYHLLNHLNLFGRSYAASAASAAREALRVAA